MFDIKDFLGKDFGDQMRILIDIGQKAEPDTLDGLFQLFLSPIDDRPVDEMIQHTLRDVLLKCEKETVKRLSQKEEKIKKLCLLVTGMQKFTSAVPVLPRLAKQEKDPLLLYEILRTMSSLKAPGFIRVFRANINHPDPMVAGISIRMAGEYQDEGSLPELIKIVEECERAERFETCSLPVAQALQSMAELGSDEVIRFFVSKLHHKNPTARRIIHEALVKTGARTISFMEGIFEKGNTDEKILASNLLGLIGDKQGGNLMVEALDGGNAVHPNVKFAIYEAFGNIKFMKGLVCLSDALGETDVMLLLSVISSLDNQLNPFVTDKLSTLVQAGDEQSERILEAVVSAQAAEVFAALYTPEAPDTANKLVQAVARCAHPPTVKVFIEKLQTLEGPQKPEHLQTLASAQQKNTGKKVLAADDSRSILAFYRSVLSGMGLEVFTALNGSEALEILQGGEMVDMLITDMNMPVMDGIELTRKVRKNPLWKNIPVIMVTTESEGSQQQLACSAGVNGFAVKPLSPEPFKQKVNDYLSQ